MTLQLNNRKLIAAGDVLLPAVLLAGGIASEGRLLPATLLLAAYLSLRSFITRRLPPLTPAAWPLALLLTLAGINLLITPDRSASLPQITRLALGALAFGWIVSVCQTERSNRLAAHGLALAGLGLAGLALFTVRWPLEKLPFIPAEIYLPLSARLAESIHPNVMAGYLVLLAPLPAAAVLWRATGERPWEAWFSLLAGAGMVTVLALTQSRGALLAAITAAALLVGLRWRHGWLFGVLSGGLALLAVGIIGFDRAAASLLTAQYGANPLDLRLEIWTRGLYLVQDFPLSGAGMGNYGPLVDRVYPLILNPPGSVPHAHNLFLQVAVDLGIPGLIAWLGIFLALGAGAWQVYRSAPPSSWQAGLGAGLIASQAAMAVHGLIDAVTWGMVRPAPLAWAVWGLAAAALNVYAKPQVENMAEKSTRADSQRGRQNSSPAGAGPAPAPHTLLGVPIHPVTVEQVIAIIVKAGKRDQRMVVAYANVHTFNLAQDQPWFREWLNRADLVYCDGFGVKWGARLAGIRLPERFTPPDWFPRLAQACAAEGLRLFFLGAQPGIAEQAAARLKSENPGLEIECEHGYFEHNRNSAENQRVVARINRFSPHLLVVGLGQPLQERWLDENWEALQANVALPVGAMFDYLAGNVTRAPRWATDRGLEWLGRLLVEPRRLWRRYLVGNPKFFWRVLFRRRE